MSTPAPRAAAVAVPPMARETRAPWKMPARMSRPSMSEPRRYSRFSPGHWSGRVTIAKGSSRNT